MSICTYIYIKKRLSGKKLYYGRTNNHQKRLVVTIIFLLLWIKNKVWEQAETQNDHFFLHYSTLIYPFYSFIELYYGQTLQRKYKY